MGLRLIKFVGSWVRKFFGALGSQNPGTKKQESISGEPFILPVVAESFSLEMSLDHCSFQLF